jgi:hypothetical protein
MVNRINYTFRLFKLKRPESCPSSTGQRPVRPGPGPLQSLRLLTEHAQFETKRSNDGDPSQSETREVARANDSGPLLPSGLRWGQHGRTLVSEWAEKSPGRLCGRDWRANPTPAHKTSPTGRTTTTSELTPDTTHSRLNFSLFRFSCADFLWA